MQIRCGYELGFHFPDPTAFVLSLNLRPEREPDLLTPQVMTSDPPVALRQYRDGFGNVCTRGVAPAGEMLFKADFVVQDSGEPDPDVRDQPQHPVDELPDDVLVYLLASRYCDTEMLANIAWANFGGTPPDGRRVQAIVDYAHQRVSFGYEHASPMRTAYGAHEEQRGVCRDFAHLAVTLCRCMNIPARYVTGYLGDIGVPANRAPMDFSAWFQVFLGGEWRTFDARHNKPRIGRILMGHGRDAADVAISTTFGPATLLGLKVITEEV
ncbi:MAG: transglutaminase family protein [Phenylobacterium sp.]